MMTNTRENEVIQALNEMLPETTSWTEQCDPAWRAAFPCGIQPKFKHTYTLTICTDQIVRAGSMLNDDDFELFLQSLVSWIFTSGVPYIFGESVEHIIGVLDDLKPDASRSLRRVAELNHCSLVTFLGADRMEYRDQ